MRRYAERVRSGEFAKEWVSKADRSREVLDELMRPIEEHEIERVGKFIRKMSGLEK